MLIEIEKPLIQLQMLQLARMTGLSKYIPDIRQKEKAAVKAYLEAQIAVLEKGKPI